MTKYSEASDNNSFRSIIANYWHFIPLMFFLFLFLLGNKYYFENNLAPPYADTNHHLTLAKQYYRFLFDRDFNIRDAQLHQKYPPLIYATASLFMKLMGATIQNALWSYSLFVIIYFFALYGIGSFFGGRMGGVAAAVIGLSCHFTIYMSHMFVPELPQTALTALALYFLLATRRFTRRTASYLFAAALALAMLTKWSSAFYLAGPIIIIAVYLFYKNPKSMLFAIPPVLCLVPLGYYYYRHGVETYRQFTGGIIEQPAWMIPVFAAVVVILIIYTFVMEKFVISRFGEDQKESARSTILFIRSLLIALLLCGLWYVYSLHGVISKLDFQKQEIMDPRIHGNEPLLIYSLKHYLNALGLYAIPMYVLALAGVVMAVIRRKDLPE
jgi:4-amino-4-deoxy-L-arabinose transferase-like glycosyltransferase